MDCLIREFLELLESKEEKLLSWGIVDGGFSENELEELAEEYLNGCKADEDVWDFLEEILERRLLFELNLRGRRLYRTRMAEAVRLFARLRQLFPSSNWQTAPTLVADYRFQIRQRIYPQRHILPETVIERLEAEKLLNPIMQIMRVFDVTAIAQFYFATEGDYGQIKAYIRMLDYLRLLILEYLRSYNSLPQEFSQVK